jgi:hypothetical protein
MFYEVKSPQDRADLIAFLKEPEDRHGNADGDVKSGLEQRRAR